MSRSDQLNEEISKLKKKLAESIPHKNINEFSLSSERERVNYEEILASNTSYKIEILEKLQKITEDKNLSSIFIKILNQNTRSNDCLESISDKDWKNLMNPILDIDNASKEKEYFNSGNSLAVVINKVFDIDKKCQLCVNELKNSDNFIKDIISEYDRIKDFDNKVDQENNFSDVLINNLLEEKWRRVIVDEAEKDKNLYLNIWIKKIYSNLPENSFDQKLLKAGIADDIAQILREKINDLVTEKIFNIGFMEKFKNFLKPMRMFISNIIKRIEIFFEKPVFGPVVEKKQMRRSLLEWSKWLQKTTVELGDDLNQIVEMRAMEEKREPEIENMEKKTRTRKTRNRKYKRKIQIRAD